jgi:hydrogenase maturation protease
MTASAGKLPRKSSAVSLRPYRETSGDDDRRRRVSLGGKPDGALDRYQHAIVIDAIGTGQHPIGTAYHFRLDDLYDPTSGHTTAAHDVSLMMAIQIGRSLGAALPERIDVVAIESPYVYDFSEELTPPVAAAVPLAAKIVVDLLDLRVDADLAQV